MLNFDLADTQAGQDLIQLGENQGEKKGKIKTSRGMVLDALWEKFEFVPPNIIDQINHIPPILVVKG